MAVQKTPRYKYVPIEEWINSEYYLGREATSIYPYWKDKIIEFFHSGERTLAFTGCSRGGKSYALIIIIDRIIYEVGYDPDFPVKFGLSPTTIPKIFFLSYSKTKASNTGISRLQRIIDQTPFYQVKGRRRRDTSAAVIFPWIEIYGHTNVQAITGEDLLCAFLDESNLRHAAVSQQMQESINLFFEMQSRTQTTFMKNGKSYGFSGIVSQSESSTSFTETQIEEMRQNHTGFIVTCAIYKVKPKQYSNNFFSIYTGDPNVSPFIIDSPTQDAIDAIASMHCSIEQYIQEHPDNVELVPEELRHFFISNMDMSLRRLCGIATNHVTTFVKESVLMACVSHDLANPSNTPLPLLGLYDPWTIEDYINPEILLQHYQGEPVYVHWDISRKFDYTGVGFVYYSLEFHEIVPLWYTSIYYNFEVADNEIDVTKLVNIVRYFLNLGVNIQYVTADGYNSVYMLQQCKLLLNDPTKVNHFSVDADAASYLLAVALFKAKRIRMYEYEEFLYDFPRLNYDPLANQGKGKIDHSYNKDESVNSYDFHDKYRKDVCDGLVGAIFRCSIVNDIRAEEILIEEKVDREQAKLSNDFYGPDLLIVSDNLYSVSDMEENELDQTDPLGLTSNLLS